MTVSPTDVLEAEHRFIAKVVNVVAMMADQLQAGEKLDPDVLLHVVAFMRTYADRSHHGKEEDLLFPALERNGVPTHGCPIEALQHEHISGRAYVKALAESVAPYADGDPAARDELLKSLRGIAQLYPGHIWKEDYLLFPLTHKVLGPQDQQALSQEFARVDEDLGLEGHQRFEAWAEQLLAEMEA